MSAPSHSSPPSGAHCSVVGLLDDGWSGLSAAARARIASAGCVIGAARTLERVAEHLDPQSTCHTMDGAFFRLPGWIEAARGAGAHSVVLATGDPLCHGIAASLIDRLGAHAVEVLPAPSTLQLACARLRLPWQDARIASCHGADAGEWMAAPLPSDALQPGAPAPSPGPAHGLYRLVRAVAGHALVLAFTSPANSPDRIARALLAAGYGDPGSGEQVRLSVVARLCLDDEAVFPALRLEQEYIGFGRLEETLKLIHARADSRRLGG